VLDHLELSVSDLDRSVEFYTAALAPLGYRLHVSNDARGFGVEMHLLDFWLRKGTVSTPRPHFAFHCTHRGLVDAAHRAALEIGGANNGTPQVLARIHPHYYAGFALDPDGHNVEFVCHEPQRA
jgi:catechol 2,3-dioxygenase-like lactoylglutathione lyase family enzyme